MKLLLSTFLCLLMMQGFSQKLPEKDVPQQVINGFGNEYPDIKAKSWEKTGETYIATARIEGQQAWVEISAEGAWLSTRLEVTEKELPAGVMDYITKSYRGYKLRESDYVEMGDGDVYYLAKIFAESSGALKELRFDVAGKLLGENAAVEQKPATREETARPQPGADKPVKPQQEARPPAPPVKAAKQEPVRTEEKHEAAVPVPDAPKAVTDAFKKKYPKAAEVTWSKKKSDYAADFKIDENAVNVQFAADGTWQMTREEMNEDQLARPILSYIDEKYSSFSIQTAEKVTTKDKKDYFCVKVVKKSRKAGQGVTELYFTKAGTFDRSVEPPEEEEPEPVQAPSEQAGQADDGLTGMTIAAGESVENIKPKELPYFILNYVTEHYPGYKIKNASYISTQEYGPVYHITVKKEGISQPSSELFIDMNGKVLKETNPSPREEPAEITKAEPVKTEKAKEATARKEQEPQAAKPGTAEHKPAERPVVKGAEKPAAETGTVETEGVPVPDAVSKGLKKRFQRTEDLSWAQSDTIYTASFVMNDENTEAQFTPRGVWIQTKTQQDPRNLYGPISNYIADYYKGYKVRAVDKVVRKDRRNYFRVELFSKKKNVSPAETEIFFDQNGKLLKQKPASLE